VTLPAIRWALAYGVVLTLARSIGEYGAVAVVSGRLIGKTQTATLVVEERFQNFDQTTAYAVSVTLAIVAIMILVLINVLRPKEHS
jgi:sulfate transport system permease protein